MVCMAKDSGEKRRIIRLVKLLTQKTTTAGAKTTNSAMYAQRTHMEKGEGGGGTHLDGDRKSVV